MTKATLTLMKTITLGLVRSSKDTKNYNRKNDAAKTKHGTTLQHQQVLLNQCIELTMSFHFFIVSLFPRLKTALRALEEKLRDDKVSVKLETSGHILTIIKVLELPPTPNTKKSYQKIQVN